MTEPTPNDFFEAANLLQDVASQYRPDCTPTPPNAAWDAPEGYALISNQAVELLRLTKKWLADHGTIEAAIRRMEMVINDIDAPYEPRPTSLRNTETKE